MGQRHIGDIIHELRENAGYSLSELSRRANVDISTLSRIERRIHHTMTLDNLARIAQALHTSVTEIEQMLGRDDKPPLMQRWPTVEEVINRDRNLTEHQKRALVEVYRSYVRR